MRRFWSFLLFAFVLISYGNAARVDTLMVHSDKMNKDLMVVYVLPDIALNTIQDTCPVIYLLHGFGDHAKQWLGTKPNLPEIADEKGIIFVLPEGEGSWYWDSPLNADSQFETFISKELIRFTDTRYPTITDRRGRAITGLSMGGHGAMWNAIRHKDVFGAVGSTSGGVDIRPFPKNWDMAKQLGSLEENKERWDEHVIANQINDLKSGELAIIFDCGESDFFYQVNCELHRILSERKIDHDFISRPGNHSHPYWRNSIDYQILFFEKFFKKKKKKK